MSNQDRLLNDQGQRKILEDFFKFGLLNDGTVNPNTLNTLERFINTQKRLYAESVIGEDETEDIDLSKRAKSRWGVRARNSVRREQRARIK